MVAYPNANSLAPPFVFPATIATGVTYDSGIQQSRGANISVWMEADQVLTYHIIRYADPKGTIVVDDASTVTVANTLSNKSLSDGKLFGWYKLTIANASGSLATFATTGGGPVILQ